MINLNYIPLKSQFFKIVSEVNKHIFKNRTDKNMKIYKIHSIFLMIYISSSNTVFLKDLFDNSLDTKILYFLQKSRVFLTFF